MKQKKIDKRKKVKGKKAKEKIGKNGDEIQ